MFTQATYTTMATVPVSQVKRVVAIGRRIPLQRVDTIVTNFTEEEYENHGNSIGNLRRSFDASH